MFLLLEMFLGIYSLKTGMLVGRILFPSEFSDLYGALMGILCWAAFTAFVGWWVRNPGRKRGSQNKS